MALGLQPGDRIASLVPNRILRLAHYLACFRTGLVSTPLNYRYAPREIDHALEVSDARALVAHVERADDLAASARAGGLLTIGLEGRLGDGPTLEQLVTDDPGPVELAPTPTSDPAMIFFTSESTGPAKGVTHSLDTLGWMVASAVDGFELTADDTFARLVDVAPRFVPGRWRRVRSARASSWPARSTRGRSSRCSVRTARRSWP
jgi:acyl-coenzyme A synthetase/AMP-(fatty) acid ligase